MRWLGLVVFAATCALLVADTSSDHLLQLSQGSIGQNQRQRPKGNANFTRLHHLVQRNVPALGGWPTAGEVKIVAFTTETYLPLAAHWYKTLTQLGYATHTVVALDDVSFANLTHRHMRCERFGHATTPHQIWPVRLAYVLNELLRGQALLLADVDMVWNRYEDLDQFRDGDVFHSFGTTWPRDVFARTGFVFCGCLGMYNPTDATVEYFRRVGAHCMNNQSHCDDQASMNKVYEYELKPEWSGTPQTDLRGYAAATNMTIRTFNTSFVSRSSECDAAGWVVAPLAKKDVASKLAAMKAYRTNCGATS